MRFRLLSGCNYTGERIDEKKEKRSGRVHSGGRQRKKDGRTSETLSEVSGEVSVSMGNGGASISGGLLYFGG